MEILQKIKKHFDSLSEKAQWEWLLKDGLELKDKMIITLDNDNTDIYFFDDEDAEFMLFFKSDIGNREGVNYLLESLGFKVQEA